MPRPWVVNGVPATAATTSLTSATITNSNPRSRFFPIDFARTSYEDGDGDDDGSPRTVTAEMMEPGQANFIARDALLQFLREYGEVALRVAEQLSRNYYTAYEEIRTLGLTSSPSEKFAKLLLSWSPDAENTTESAHLKLTLTHEEIAEMIGTTRETVSRLFSDFKKKQLLQLKGSTLIIRNKPALEKIVNS